MDSKVEQAKQDELDLELIGFVGVDSGRMIIKDPAYPDDKHAGLKVEISTVSGDGMFPVFNCDGVIIIDTNPQYKEGPRLTGIKITWIE